MEFHCSKSKLIETVPIVTRAIQGVRVVRPILANVLIEVKDGFLKMTSTDQELTTYIELPVESSQNGETTVSGRFLTEIIQNIGHLTAEQIQFETQENGQLKISSGKASFNLPTIPSSEYPKTDLLKTSEFSVKFPGDELRRLIRQGLISVATEEAKPAYKAIHCEVNQEKIFFVSTDSRRMAVSSVSLNDLEVLCSEKKNFNFLIPKRCLEYFSRFQYGGHLENQKDVIQMDYCGHQVSFSGPNFQFISRLIDDQFPNWRQVLPRNGNRKVVFKKEDLKNGLKILTPIAREEAFISRLVLKNGVAIISSSSANHGSVTHSIPVEFEGEEIEMGLNSKFLLDALNVLDGEKGILELSAPLYPGLLYGENQDQFSYVLMPVLLE